MKAQTFYTGGPMRGFPLYNFPLFFRAAQALRDAGYGVENPAEHDMARGFNPAEPLDSPTNSKVFNINEALKGDFEIILAKCDGLVVLPGWRKSTGTCAEVVVAHYSGLQIWEFRWTSASGEFDLAIMEDKPSITFGKGEEYTGDVPKDRIDLLQEISDGEAQGIQYAQDRAAEMLREDRGS